MRVLMTGSHGFVGTNLMRALGGEHEIIAWNAREDRPLPEVEAVIHLAGKAHDTKHTTEAEEYFRVNTELTKQLYQRFLESSARKFIFFSSIKAQDGDTPYALSKREAEKIITGTTNYTDITNGLVSKTKCFYILRPCMIHGAGVKGNLPLLFHVVKTGLPWPLAAFENQRSYASMGNVIYVVRALLKQNVESGIYHLCDDEPVSTNELIRLIAESTGRKCWKWRIPKRLMRLVASAGDKLHLPLNTERLGKLTEDYVVDNSDMKRALGISQMPVRAVDGLRETISLMVKNQ